MAAFRATMAAKRAAGWTPPARGSYRPRRPRRPSLELIRAWLDSTGDFADGNYWAARYRDAVTVLLDG